MKQYIKVDINVYRYEGADILTFSKQSDNVIDDQTGFTPGGDGELFE